MHIIVSVRLLARKGISLLIDSVHTIHINFAFQVDVFGDEDERIFLDQKVVKLNLCDKIVFHGKVDYITMQEKYKKGDIFCLPSLRESTGTAVFEAMANKLPVIALKHLIENQRYRIQLEENCYKKLTKYTWDEKVKYFNTLYHNIIVM